MGVMSFAMPNIPFLAAFNQINELKSCTANMGVTSSAYQLSSMVHSKK